jgi:hypothetical protein
MKEAKRLGGMLAMACVELEAKYGKEAIDHIAGELLETHRRGVPPEQRVFVPWVDASKYA